MPIPEEAFPHVLVLQGLVLANKSLDETFALVVVEYFPY